MEHIGAPTLFATHFHELTELHVGQEGQGGDIEEREGGGAGREMEARE